MKLHSCNSTPYSVSWESHLAYCHLPRSHRAGLICKETSYTIFWRRDYREEKNAIVQVEASQHGLCVKSISKNLFKLLDNCFLLASVINMWSISLQISVYLHEISIIRHSCSLYADLNTNSVHCEEIAHCLRRVKNSGGIRQLDWGPDWHRDRICEKKRQEGGGWGHLEQHQGAEGVSTISITPA